MTNERYPIAIIGAGGHGQVIADALRANPETAHLGLVFLDDDPAIQGEERMGIPVAGTIADLGTIAHIGVVIGIGNNHARRRLALALEAAGEQFVAVLHPRSIVATGVLVGAGTVLLANAVVNTGAKLGKHVILNTGCTVDHHNLIGDFAHVAPGSHLGGNVEIGEGGFVGIGATVMPQRKIGAWATVGAGALAHRDVPPGATVVGVPARVQGPATDSRQSS